METGRAGGSQIKGFGQRRRVKGRARGQGKLNGKKTHQILLFFKFKIVCSGSTCKNQLPLLPPLVCHCYDNS